jgi:phosphoserine phosphatase
MSGTRSTVIHMVGPGDLGSSIRCVVDLGLPLEEVGHKRDGAMISFSARVTGTPTELQSKTLRAWAEGSEMHLTMTEASSDAPYPAIAVTLLGSGGLGSALARLVEVMKGLGLEVAETRSVGERTKHGVELLVSASPGGELGAVELQALSRKILEASRGLDVDVAVQRNDFFRKNRRLVCLDVDSTFVQGEFIDELAELAGVKPAVAEITSRAMRGELDFQAALRERVALLAGLPMERALTLCERFVLSPGAEDLARALRRLGVRVGLVSGGFDFFVDRLRSRFELDFAFANQLEVENERLTGRVLGAIVDGQRKAQVLRDMANVYRIDTRQTVAVGDGANDIFMLEAAGLGIAYQAKPKLLAHADAYFLHHDRLDTMLYLMGFDPPEVKDACSEC